MVIRVSSKQPPLQIELQPEVPIALENNISRNALLHKDAIFLYIL